MARDPEKRRKQVREAVQRFRDKRRNPGPGRPRKNDAAPKPKPKGAPAPDAPKVPPPKTPEEARDWLARVMAGEIEASGEQVSASRVMLDSRRRDGGSEDDLPAWVRTEQEAAEDLLLAERHHEAAVPPEAP